MLEAGVITAIGFIWILCRLPLKRVAGYALGVDVIITGVLMMIFAGTYAGMMTGVLAGVLVSLFLTIVKRTAGAERLALTKRKGSKVPGIKWKEVQ